MASLECLYIDVKCDFPCADFLILLESCPLLTYIKISILGPAPPQSCNSVTHNVKDLHIINHRKPSWELCQLIGFLTLPCLELLELGFVPLDTPISGEIPFPSSLADLFRRSFCHLPSAPLKQLRIRHYSLTFGLVDDFVRALSYVPNLEELNVFTIPLPDEILRSFTFEHNPTGSHFCPNLHISRWC